MDNIVSDMKVFAEHEVDGFVFGALLPNRDIDVDNCTRVLENANGLPVTFHRAFDMSKPSQQSDNLKLLSNLGFKRVLTSGFAETAELGIEVLKNCHNYVLENNLDLIIMPGCGITPANAEYILRETGCQEFHGSAKIKIIESIPAHAGDTQAITDSIKSNFCNFADATTVKQLAQIRDLVLLAK